MARCWWAAEGRWRSSARLANCLAWFTGTARLLLTIWPVTRAPMAAAMRCVRDRCRTGARHSSSGAS
ncbi:hypothetical protein XCR_3889 [Xanthomonas campestris pv. raphani 756C]|nr:hypothetical protein XCR_3889 [Xanthomonas campestris pv. raphani 756C]